VIFVFALFVFALLFLLNNVYCLGVRTGKLAAKAEAEAAAAADDAADEEGAAGDFPEPEEDDDVCLRPGARVVCNLSDHAHTHGVILGFTMSAIEGPMLAIVDLGCGGPPMPINVDLVDPVDPDGDGPTIGYRDNAGPKQWN